jgi:hypothetical protein
MGPKLGAIVKDTITGFKGILTARTTFLTGCTRVCIQPKVDKDGKLPDAAWFDEPSIIQVDEPPATVTDEQKKDPGGPNRYDYPG